MAETRELLSGPERAAVEAAVVAAERESGAEIVPALLPACGTYAVADARGAALGALLGALALLAAPDASDGWRADPRWLAPAVVFLGALGGFALARLDAVRRALAGAEIEERVDAAAAAQFLARNVFRTRDRTGILILVSLFEHQVRVLADEAVYRAVERATWERLAADVARAMAGGGRPGAALLQAVEAAGRLVGAHGPRRTPDDTNELPDAPSVERAPTA